MKTPRLQLTKVVAERTLHISDTKKLAREIAAYLMSNKLEQDLEPLLRDVLLYRMSKGIVEAKVVSAHELNKQATTDIVSLLKEHFPKAKSVIVRSEIEPEIIGGVRIRLPEEQLDLSIRAKLDTFKRLTKERIA